MNIFKFIIIVTFLRIGDYIPPDQNNTYFIRYKDDVKMTFKK